MLRAYRQFNAQLSQRAADFLCSMECFWLIEALVLLPLIFPGTLAVVQFVSSGWFQAVALPLLGASGVLAAQRVMVTIQETHDAVIAELRLVQESHAAILAVAEAIHAHVVERGRS